MTPVFLAKATIRPSQSRSTHVVVGLWGNERTITLGRGQAFSHASVRLAKNSSWSPASGTWRTSAPANKGAYRWIGYDGVGTRAVSPLPSSTHIRCDNP